MGKDFSSTPKSMIVDTCIDRLHPVQKISRRLCTMFDVVIDLTVVHVCKTFFINAHASLLRAEVNMLYKISTFSEMF